MESFELTFFCKKENFDKDIINILKKSKIFLKPLGKKYLTEYFEEKNKDYVELRVSIFDLVITKENFFGTIEQLSIFVASIFEKVTHITFATGIYELTYYFIEGKESLNEFDSVFIMRMVKLYFN